MRKLAWVIMVGLVVLVVPLGNGSAQDAAPELSVWAQHVRTEFVGWRIEYRDVDNTVVASFDLPSYPLSYPDNHIAGRLIGTNQTDVLLFTPDLGYVAALNVPDMPADFGDDWYMITALALSPDGQRYAYNLNHQPADYEQPADTRLYIAMTYAGDDRLIFEEEHQAYLAVEPVAWSADGTRLLVRTMPQGLGGYILFLSDRDVRILDIDSGAVLHSLGDIDGYSANFETIARLGWADNEMTGLEITEVANGDVTHYPLPDLGEQPGTGGGVVFSPDARYVAYQVARHDSDNEQVWTIVVDRVTGESNMVFAESGTNWWALDYGYISGWLDDTRLAIGDVWSGNTVVMDVTNGNLIDTEPERVFLGYATGIVDTTGFAQSYMISVPCSGAPLTRLHVSDSGRITFTTGAPTNVRDQPGTAGVIIATLPEGALFTVLQGPVCAGDYAWWRLEFDDGVIGWVAEGDADGYFLESWYGHE